MSQKVSPNNFDSNVKEIVRQAMKIIGSSKSEKKRNAAVINGKKGGAPKKKQPTQGN